MPNAINNSLPVGNLLPSQSSHPSLFPTLRPVPLRRTPDSSRFNLKNQFRTSSPSLVISAPNSSRKDATPQLRTWPDTSYSMSISSTVPRNKQPHTPSAPHVAAPTSYHISTPRSAPSFQHHAFSTPRAQSQDQDQSPTAQASSRKDARLSSGQGSGKLGRYSLRPDDLLRTTLDKAALVRLGKMDLEIAKESVAMAEAQRSSARERLGKWKGKYIGGMKEDRELAVRDIQARQDSSVVDPDQLIGKENEQAIPVTGETWAEEETGEMGSRERVHRWLIMKSRDERER